MSTSLMTGSRPDITEALPFKFHGRVVLILCGLIASGKSTFSEHLQHFFPHFRRCNQDDLGQRRYVEQLARESLNRGLSVCIDRTNFNSAQRSHWIGIAREFPETAIWVIVFDTPYEICAVRLQKRRGHPTIRNPEEGLTVLARFANDFQYPAPLEGYDRILYVKPSDHPSQVYSHSEVANILKRVRDSPAVMSDIGSGASSFRDNLNRGSRGGWRRGWVSRGGGGNNFNPGPSGRFRGKYRGRSVGGRGEKRGQWYYTSVWVENQAQVSANDGEGTGTAQDPFKID